MQGYFLNFNKVKVIAITILIMLLLSCVAPTTAYADNVLSGVTFSIDGKDIRKGNDKDKGFNALIENLKVFIIGIAGIATVTAVGFFIVNFVKLGFSNSATRADAISGLIYSGVAMAGLGSVTLITAIFYGMAAN